MFLLQPKTLQKTKNNVFSLSFPLLIIELLQTPSSHAENSALSFQKVFLLPFTCTTDRKGSILLGLFNCLYNKAQLSKPARKVLAQATHTALSHMSTDLNIQTHNQSKRLPHISCISRGQPIIHNISFQIPHCMKGFQVFLPSLPEKDFQFCLFTCIKQKLGCQYKTLER